MLHRIETKSRFNTLEFTLIPSASGESDEKEVLCVGTEKGVVEVRSVVIGDAPEPVAEEREEGDEAMNEDQGEKTPTGGAKLDLLVTLVGHTNR